MIQWTCATAPLAGCAGSLSTLDAAGPVASSVALLWWVMLIGSGFLFALVMLLFAIVAFRPAVFAGVEPRRWIILGGLVLPALVLPPLVGWSLVSGDRLLPLPATDVPRIEAEGRQWAWTFRYPDHGGAESDRLHLPAGQPVDIVVTSLDVIHGFWIPRLGGKIDAVPGHENVVRLQADFAGRLEGVCAEFCGLDHTVMRFEVLAHEPEDFLDALNGEQPQ